uniref:Semaphorin 6C n=1 Tax=Macaca nemestrina TaxID=9545 RepID=A0A2K6CJY9_MACNE
MPRAPHFMPLLLLLLLLSLSHTQAAFPQDPLPLLISDLQGSSPLSWFRGLEDDAVAAELGLDFQRFLTLNRTLLVAARDHVFSFDLQAQEEGEGLVPNKYLTWRSQDVENCAVRGKLTDECYNYIRVLVPWDSQTLLACGTNSFSPVCRSYGITSLQQEGEELSGQARCPFDATQSNVAVFAEGSLYSATAADFQASDAVVYRSLGPQPPLRSAKYDSKWLREPHFVHALEHGDHVYFFFREVSVEDARLGRVQFSRVARVCKRDMGGSPRALDRHWTSFLKLRLNCSVPGDSTFYFDVLQALTGPVNLHGRSALFGVFTTQTNSIPGSAVCAFYLDEIERGFEGKFKEQRSLDGAWTPVSEDRVPSPRPGSCAGIGGAALSPSCPRSLPSSGPPPARPSRTAAVSTFKGSSPQPPSSRPRAGRSSGRLTAPSPRTSSLPDSQSLPWPLFASGLFIDCLSPCPRERSGR